jgi:hypothetical protein
MQGIKKWLCGIWTLPNTLIELLFLPGAINGSVDVVDGALEIEGPLIRKTFRLITNSRGTLLALTIGQVVIGSNKTALLLAREHERVHVRQFERWGICFLPVYLLASAWAIFQGKHPYTGNRFEREAYEASPPTW